MNIQLEPAQIEELSTKITSTVKDLTDIDAILHDTENDLKEVEQLKNQSLATK